MLQKQLLNAEFPVSFSSYLRLTEEYQHYGARRGGWEPTTNYIM